MATQLASQHQPVRVIRGAGSTPPIARPGPGSQGRQPRPARRPGKALPQHPAIGIQMRTTQPPATQRRPERPGLARNHTTIPTARSSHGAWPGWRVAHPIRSDQAAVPGHTHGSPARQIKPIWMQSPASGTQQLGMQNGYTRLAPVLGPITDGEEEHPSSGARSPTRRGLSGYGVSAEATADRLVRGGRGGRRGGLCRRLPAGGAGARPVAAFRRASAPRIAPRRLRRAARGAGAAG